MEGGGCFVDSMRGGVERWTAVMGGGGGSWGLGTLSVASEDEDTPVLSFVAWCSLPLGENTTDTSSEVFRRRANARLSLKPPATAAFKPLVAVDGEFEEDEEASGAGNGGVGLL